MLKNSAKAALAALALTIAIAAQPASADQNRPSVADQKIQMAMLADMVNNSAFTVQENGDALTIDAIETQFEKTAAKQYDETAAENLTASDPDKDC